MMDEKMTIETLADELSVSRADLKTALKIPATAANKTELTDEQAEAGRAFDFKAQEKQVKTDEPVTFYWRSKKRPSFTLGREAIGDGTFLPVFTRAGVNGVMHLRHSNREDARMIKYLRAHLGNEKNGGIKFTEFKLTAPDSGSPASKLDELYALPIHTLTQLAADKSGGSLIKAGAMTTGQKIEAILNLAE
jgi:hypothetical protein